MPMIIVRMNRRGGVVGGVVVVLTHLMVIEFKLRIKSSVSGCRSWEESTNMNENEHWHDYDHFKYNDCHFGGFKAPPCKLSSHVERSFISMHGAP